MRLSMLAVGTFCMALGFGVVAGCEDDDDDFTVDPGVSTGGTVGSGGTGGTGVTGGTYGTGGVGGTGGSTAGTGGSMAGTGGATGGAGGTTAGTGGTTGGTNGGTTVTYAQVQPLFAAKCTPCHATGGIGASAHTLASSNAGATAASSNCPGQTKGACALTLVKSGQMPMGRGCTGNPAQDAANTACLTQAEQDLLAAWIAGGLM